MGKRAERLLHSAREETRTISDKTAEGSGTPPTGAQVAATKLENAAAAKMSKMEQVAVEDARSLGWDVAWRVLLGVALIIAHEGAIIVWKRMTHKPVPEHHGRIRGL